MNNQASSHLDLGVSRLILLGISSILLSMSYVFSVLSPFPLGLAMVIYGKKKGGIVVGLTLLLSFIISLFVFKSLFLVASIFISAIVAIACSQTIINNYSPVKSIAINGFGIIALISGMSYFAVTSQNINIKEYLVQEITQKKAELDKAITKDKSVLEDESAFDVQALLAQPELAADYIIREMPGYFMMSVFFIIWINLGLLARSRRITLYLMGKEDELSKNSLFNIKLPDQLVIAVAIALALVVFEENLSSIYGIIGMTSLKVLGVFYFFQGFGIYIAFLNFAKIRGFFRSILIVLTIFSAGQVLAIVGLLDTFLNFRKFLNKK